MDQQVVAAADESGALTKSTKTKPSYKHVPHSQKPAHLVAKRNARERRRVQAVNQAFYRLRKCVPIENRNKRVSKVKTLHRAIDYIRKLERILADEDSAGSGSAQLEGAAGAGDASSLQVGSVEIEAARKLQQRKEERRLKRAALAVANNNSCEFSAAPVTRAARTGRAAASKQDASSAKGHYLRNRFNQMAADDGPAMQNEHAFPQAPQQQQVPPANNCHQQPVYQHQHPHQHPHLHPHQHHPHATQETILRDSSAYHTNLNYYGEQASGGQCCEPYEMQPADQQAHLGSSGYLAAASGYYADASSSPHIGADLATYAPADSTTGSLYSLATGADSDWCKRAGGPQQQLSAARPVPAHEPDGKRQLAEAPGGAPAFLRSPPSRSSAADSPSGGDNSSTTAGAATARRPPAAAGPPPQQQPQHPQQRQQVNSQHGYLAYAAEARAVHLSFALINDNNGSSASYHAPAPHLTRQPEGGGGAGRKSANSLAHHQVVGQHSANTLLYLQNQQPHHQPAAAATNMQLHHHHNHNQPQPQPQQQRHEPPPHQQPSPFLNNQHVQQAANHLSAPHLGPAPELLALHQHPGPAPAIQEYST